jgi:hypothetical protein
MPFLLRATKLLSVYVTYRKDKKGRLILSYPSTMTQTNTPAAISNSPTASLGDVQHRLPRKHVRGLLLDNG